MKESLNSLKFLYVICPRIKSQEEFKYKETSLQYDIVSDEDTDIIQVKSKDSDKMSEENKN